MERIQLNLNKFYTDVLEEIGKFSVRGKFLQSVLARKNLSFDSRNNFPPMRFPFQWKKGYLNMRKFTPELQYEKLNFIEEKFQNMWVFERERGEGGF